MYWLAPLSAVIDGAAPGSVSRQHVDRARRVARPHERVGQARDLARILVAAGVGGQPRVDRAGGDPLQEQVRRQVVLRRRELVDAVRSVEVEARVAHELPVHVPARHRDRPRLRADVEAALVERATLLLELRQVAEGDCHRGATVTPVLVLLGPDPAERVLRAELGRLDHVVQRLDAAGPVDQRLHVVVPVVRHRVARRRVAVDEVDPPPGRRAQIGGAEQAVVGAVEELRHVRLLVPRLRRCQRRTRTWP